jgi:phosphoglycerate dehydrogenase-like enzyme
VTRIAVLDDWQSIARESADWTQLQQQAEVVFFEQPFGSAEAVAQALAEFDIIVPMRERTHFPAELIARLPRLRMIAVTGSRIWTLNIEACTARGIVVACTGGTQSTAATAEITLGLLLAATRYIPAADASIHAGGFQAGVPAGIVLDGKTLGVIGLGKIGARLAHYGQALGMHVLAWSPNLTAERATAAGARLVDKQTLLRESDVVTLHVVLSDRSRGMIGQDELACLKRGAILVNSSRGPLIDEGALLDALHARKLVAALDVYDREPLPLDHPLRTAPNTVLTPHLGYCTREVYRQFYTESIENILAFLDGKPMRLLNPEAKPHNGPT